MKQLSDCLLLFVCSLSLTLFCQDLPQAVTGFLVTLICLSAALLFQRKSVYIPAFLCWTISALLTPWQLIFLPPVLYTVCTCKSPLLFALCLLPAAFHVPAASPRPAAFLLCFCLAALLLARRTQEGLRLEKEVHAARDTGMERNLLLEEKNRALLENQDYQMYTATLKERNRISREIHDNVGHMLSRSILMTGAIRTVSQDRALDRPLEELEDTLHTAMTSIRRTVHDLRDDSVSLKEAMEDLIRDFQFCSASLSYEAGLPIPREVKYSVIMICKEALSNVIRHSDASRVTVSFREHPGFYRLCIQDNGTSAPLSLTDGMGLSNMKERIRCLGGVIQFNTEQGFSIHASVPKAAAKDMTERKSI